jgi:hypothetical protein
MRNVPTPLKNTPLTLVSATVTLERVSNTAPLPVTNPVLIFVDM